MSATVKFQVSLRTEAKCERSLAERFEVPLAARRESVVVQSGLFAVPAVLQVRRGDARSRSESEKVDRRLFFNAAYG